MTGRFLFHRRPLRNVKDTVHDEAKQDELFAYLESLCGHGIA
jgi:hypothetical protein